MVRKINLDKRPALNLDKRPGFDLNKPSPGLFPGRKPSRPPPAIFPRGSLEFPEIEPPQEGLINIPNTPFWLTPPEPASPTDCDRYPNSIFCGNPFKPGLLGIDFALVLDPCNIGAQLTPFLGFISMPSFQIVYRDPNCRQPPPPPPDSSANSPVYVPPNNCAKGGRSIVISWVDSYELEEHGTSDRYEGVAFIKETDSATLDNFEFPVSDGETVDIQYFNGKKYVTINTPVICRIKFTFRRSVFFNQTYKNEFRWSLPDNEAGSYGGSEETTKVYKLTDYNESFYFQFDSEVDVIHPNGGKIWINDYGDAKRHLDNLVNYQQNRFYGDSTYTQSIVEKVHFKVALNCGGNTNPPSPPPLLPPRRCCMGCCPNTSNNNNDALLQLLIQKVDKLSQIVGVDEYPASLPQSLITKDEGFLGNLIPNPNVEVPNLTKLLGWFIERFDEIMGQFEIPIEIKDSDPTTPGEQPVGLKISNVAEAMAEAIGLLLQVAYNTEALINIGIRTLVETGGDKVQNFKTYMLLDAATEYWGFKYNEVVKKINLTFKPGEEGLDKMLIEHQQDVLVADFDEKLDFQACLQRLLEAAAIIKATNFRKIDINDNIKNQVLDILKSRQEIAKKINENEKDEDGNNSFDQFRQEVEDGFINTPGVANTTDPYGKSFQDRPRLKDID